MSVKVDLHSAVNDAVKKVEADTADTSDKNTETQDTQTTEDTDNADATTDTTDPDQKADDETKKSTAVDSDTEIALAIYNALRDPNKAISTLQDIAQQFGLEVKRGETTKKAAKATIKELVKQGLGKEYEFLADRLGNVLEQVVDSQVEERTAPISRKLLEMEARGVNNEITRELADLHSRTKGASAKLENEIMNWMSKYQPAPDSNVTIREFLEDAWSAVSQGAAVSDKLKKTVDRVNKNAKDATVASSGVDETRTRTGSHRISVSEAVRLAMQGKRVSA